jgi:hypothetical protein
MITEKGNIFSNAQALVASGAENSTNVIDTEVAGSNIGAGTPIWVYCRVNTLFTAASSSTMIVSLQNSATSGGTYTSIFVGPTLTVGQLVKGFDLCTIPLPVDNLRYLKMVYTQGVGSGWTAGNVDALLTLNAPLN